VKDVPDKIQLKAAGGSFAADLLLPACKEIPFYLCNFHKPEHRISTKIEN
jgi:hypothetical protein